MARLINWINDLIKHMNNENIINKHEDIDNEYYTPNVTPPPTPPPSPPPPHPPPPIRNNSKNNIVTFKLPTEKETQPIDIPNSNIIDNNNIFIVKPMPIRNSPINLHDNLELNSNNFRRQTHSYCRQCYYNQSYYSQPFICENCGVKGNEYETSDIDIRTNNILMSNILMSNDFLYNDDTRFIPISRNDSHKHFGNIRV